MQVQPITLTFQNQDTLTLSPKFIERNPSAFSDIQNNAVFTDGRTFDIVDATKEQFELLIQMGSDSLVKPVHLNAQNAGRIYHLVEMYDFKLLKSTIDHYLAKKCPLAELEEGVLLEKKGELGPLDEGQPFLLRNALINHFGNPPALTDLVARIKTVAKPSIKEHYQDILLNQLKVVEQVSENLGTSPRATIVAQINAKAALPQKISSDSLPQGDKGIVSCLELLIKQRAGVASFCNKALATLNVRQKESFWELLLLAFENCLQDEIHELKYMIPGWNFGWAQDFKKAHKGIHSIAALQKIAQELQAVAAKDDALSGVAEDLNDIIHKYPIQLSGRDFIPRRFRDENGPTLQTFAVDYKNVCTEILVDTATRVTLYAGFIFSLAPLYAYYSTEALIGISVTWLMISPSALVITAGTIVGVAAAALFIYNFALDVLREAGRTPEGGTVLIFMVAGISFGYCLLIKEIARKADILSPGGWVIHKFARLAAPKVANTISQ